MKFKVLIGLSLIPLLMSIHGISEDDGFVGAQINSDLRVPTEDLTRNDLGVMLYNDLPFTGLALSYSYEDKLSEQARYKDGKMDGDLIGYFPNGRIKYIRPYKNGQKHGIHIGWHLNGNIRFYYIFEYGLSEGNHKEWYENGDLMQDLNYVKGKPLGPQKVWRTDGKMRANYVVKENGRRYGLMGIKRCTKLDGDEEKIDPFKNN